MHYAGYDPSEQRWEKDNFKIWTPCWTSLVEETMKVVKYMLQ